MERRVGIYKPYIGEKCDKKKKGNKNAKGHSMDSWTNKTTSSHTGQRSMSTALSQHPRILLSTEDMYLSMNGETFSLWGCSILEEKERKRLYFTKACYNAQWGSRTAFHSSCREQRSDIHVYIRMEDIPPQEQGAAYFCEIS